MDEGIERAKLAGRSVEIREIPNFIEQYNTNNTVSKKPKI